MVCKTDRKWQVSSTLGEAITLDSTTSAKVYWKQKKMLLLYLQTMFNTLFFLAPTLQLDHPFFQTGGLGLKSLLLQIRSVYVTKLCGGPFLSWVTAFWGCRSASNWQGCIGKALRYWFYFCFHYSTKVIIGADMRAPKSLSMQYLHLTMVNSSPLIFFSSAHPT